MNATIPTVAIFALLGCEPRMPKPEPEPKTCSERAMAMYIKCVNQFSTTSEGCQAMAEVALDECREAAAQGGTPQ